MDTQNKDEYLFYESSDGTIFYYKNGKLHREAGPAIVVAQEKYKYTGLDDTNLYKRALKPLANNTLETGFINIMTYTNTDENGKFTVSTMTLTNYFGSSYYLEGVLHSDQEFQIVRLKENMEKELHQKSIDKSKIKL